MKFEAEKRKLTEAKTRARSDVIKGDLTEKEYKEELKILNKKIKELHSEFGDRVKFIRKGG